MGNNPDMPGIEDFFSKKPEQRWLCLQCIAEMFYTQGQIEAGRLPENTALPPIDDAVTLAPSWQAQAIPAQGVLYACVAVPTCFRHLNVKEKSVEERATEGGIVLGRPNG